MRNDFRLNSQDLERVFEGLTTIYVLKEAKHAGNKLPGFLPCHDRCTVPHGLPWPISLQACPHIERNLDFVSNNGGWSVDYRRIYDLTALCRIISTHIGILREKAQR